MGKGGLADRPAGNVRELNQRSVDPTQFKRRSSPQVRARHRTGGIARPANLLISEIGKGRLLDAFC
jgi:hypothetical protein